MLEDVKGIIGFASFGIFLCVMFYVKTVIRQKYVERENSRRARTEAERRLKYLQLIEYSRAHLPNVEPPRLDCDWTAVDGLIAKGLFFIEGVGDIHKSDLDSDTLQLIDLLRKDVNWFFCNPTGDTLSEQSETLENFLREKYPRLSEESISRIRSSYLREQSRANL